MADDAGARTSQVMNAIRARVASRAIGPGDRLPSVRSFAATMSVSPSTVVEAYDRLVAEGLVRARRGSGFFVAASAAAPLTLMDAGPQHDRAVDPFWVSRQALDSAATAPKPGCGWLPADWMPVDAIRRSLRALARADDATLADYGSTRGALALRRYILGRLSEEGVEAGLEQVMLTASGSQSIDLICRFLLRPGDVVLVDDPCYFNFRAALRAQQAEIVSVPYAPSGPDLAAFEAVLAERRPRLYLTNCALHNPTGASMTPQTAHRLLNLAAAHDLIIVEDDIFADFEPEPSPRLAALDGLERVIRIGSFSKTLSASMRCGYIAARREWIEELINVQVASSFSGASPMTAEIIGQILTGGGYRKHMEGVRRRLTKARREVAGRLFELGVTPWIEPRGGFYLWCSLPDGASAADVAKRALADDVVLAPGDVFSVAGTASNMMRFNVAQCGDRRVWSALRKALETAKA